MPKKNKFDFIKQNKGLCILLLCQLLVLAMACGNYLLNRGKAFSHTYTQDNFNLVAGEQNENGGITIEDRHGHSGSFLNFTEALDKGVYVVSVNYHTNSEDNMLSASTSEVSDLDFRTAPVALDPTLHTAYITVDLARDTDVVNVEVSFCGEGYLVIDQISISETSNYYKRNLVHAFCLCVLFACGYAFYRADKTKRSTMLGVTTIFVLSCYPLMTDYMQVGHDLPFHLLRIEGIYTGLLQGTFPVKIHPVWAKDYGYAVGVFYGDAALYFPAFLRLFGFSIQAAYKAFVILTNLATVLISYFCFRKMFKNNNAGLVGCALYTFSLYRLSDVYTRAAVGEYTALTFLPLVLCGFYLIFTETNQKNWLKNAALVALGLTGVIQSHVLSCVMIVLFVIVLCLILIKKVIQPHTFLALVFGAALTILMNIGFLVPFLSFYDDSVYINSPDWGVQTAYSIQNQGMFPVQLLGLMHRTDGGSWATLAGTNNEASYSLGLALTLCVVLFLYITLCCRNKEEKDPLFKPALLCCGMGLLALYMSSCYFPWDTLAGLGTTAQNLISTLQFPWRFLALATVLLVFPACYAIINAEKYFTSTKTSVILGTLASLFIVSSGWYFYQFSFLGGPYRVYDTYELDSMTMYSYEYLPAGTDPDQITAGALNHSDTIVITDYQKNGTTITCNVTTTNEGYIEFPLNYYKYYECRDLTSSANLPVEAGYNCMVKVTIPEGYNGRIKLEFAEPLFWRICEAISFLSVLGATVILLPVQIKIPKQRKHPNAQAEQKVSA